MPHSMSIWKIMFKICLKINKPSKKSLRLLKIYLKGENFAKSGHTYGSFLFLPVFKERGARREEVDEEKEEQKEEQRARAPSFSLQTSTNHTPDFIINSLSVSLCLTTLTTYLSPSLFRLENDSSQFCTIPLCIKSIECPHLL